MLTVTYAPQALADNYVYLDKVYQFLHANPELSDQEVETSKRIAQKMRAAGFEVTYSEPTSSACNDLKLTERMSAVLMDVLGAVRVHQVSPVVAGEDFSYFGGTDPKIPSLIFWLGAVSGDTFAAAECREAQLPNLHSSFYAPDRVPTIKTGADAMTGVASLLCQ